MTRSSTERRHSSASDAAREEHLSELPWDWVIRALSRHERRARAEAVPAGIEAAQQRSREVLGRKGEDWVNRRVRMESMRNVDGTEVGLFRLAVGLFFRSRPSGGLCER